MRLHLRHAVVYATCSLGLSLPAWSADQPAEQVADSKLTIPVKMGAM